MPKFPLFKHRNGQWAKKIKGKLHYFGTDKQAALVRWQQETLGVQGGRYTILDLLNHFLYYKKRSLSRGEIVARTYRDYYHLCKRVRDACDTSQFVDTLGPAFFTDLRDAIAGGRSLLTLNQDVKCIRSIFRFAWDQEIISQPLRMGQAMRMRKCRPAVQRIFSAAEIRDMLANASRYFRPLILLGINGGLGTAEVSHLSEEHVDRETRWVNYPRPKTGVGRRFRLWPDAHLPALPLRSKSNTSWSVNNVNCHMKRLPHYKKGRSFYALRHTFQTVADMSAEKSHVIQHIMGHVPTGMSAVYREYISDQQIDNVMAFVHNWLWNS